MTLQIIITSRMISANLFSILHSFDTSGEQQNIVKNLADDVT